MMLLPMIVNGAAVEINGIYYNLDNRFNTAEVAQNPNASGKVTIPQKVSFRGVSYNVKSIGQWAFSRCTRLTSVTIPNSVNSIGEGSFQWCDGLTSIVVEDGNTYYDSRDGCNAIIRTYDNVLIIGCKNTIIPNSVMSIGEYAFRCCEGLTSITIPGNVINIGDQAFQSCGGLTSVTISNGVTNIGDHAFSSCSGLTSVTIPNSVTNIGVYAFSGCLGLTSVTISNGVTNIGDGAFSGCRGLTSIIIPNSVINIGDWMFSNCSGLTTVTISNSVTSIGKNAFWYCSGLTSVTIPSSVTTIGELAFGRSGLTSVTIPNSVTSIGEKAFWECSDLTSVTIPNSVTDIGREAFYGCNRLTSVNIFDLEAWCNISFYDNPLQYAHHLYLNGEEVKEVIFPDGITAIKEIFADCPNLTSVIIPNSVISIYERAFFGCSGLSSVSIPNSVMSIGRSAFEECRGLISITIPNSVTDIRNWAFSGCRGLKDVFCYAIDVPNTDDNAFNLLDFENAVLHVPSGSIDAYASTAPWNKFKHIVPIEEDDLQEYLNSLNSFDDTQDVLSGSIYTRQFLNTEWQSLYVPFSLSYSDWSNNFEVARLDKFSQYDDDDGEADRQELEVVIMRSGSDVLNANTPYLIRAKKAGTYNFTVNPSNLVAEQINSITYSANGSKVVITGNYANQSGLKSAGCYRLMGGSLSIPTKDEEVLPPYRWFATIDNSDKAKVRISFVDNATGIEPIDVDTEEMIGERRVYDLSGRRINISKDTPISSLPKGIYIINNKNYLVK